MNKETFETAPATFIVDYAAVQEEPGVKYTVERMLIEQLAAVKSVVKIQTGEDADEQVARTTLSQLAAELHRRANIFLENGHPIMLVIASGLDYLAQIFEGTFGRDDEIYYGARRKRGLSVDYAAGAKHGPN